MNETTRRLVWRLVEEPFNQQLRAMTADALTEDGRTVEAAILRDEALDIAARHNVVWLESMPGQVWYCTIARKPAARERVGNWLRWMRRLAIRGQQRLNGKHCLSQYHELAEDWASLSSEYQALHGSRKSREWYWKWGGNVSLSIMTLKRMAYLLPLGAQLDELLPV